MKAVDKYSSLLLENSRRHSVCFSGDPGGNEAPLPTEVTSINQFILTLLFPILFSLLLPSGFLGSSPKKLPALKSSSQSLPKLCLQFITKVINISISVSILLLIIITITKLFPFAELLSSTGSMPITLHIIFLILLTTHLQSGF